MLDRIAYGANKHVHHTLPLLAIHYLGLLVVIYFIHRNSSLRYSLSGFICVEALAVR
jgi:hypothetical protein